MKTSNVFSPFCAPCLILWHVCCCAYACSLKVCILLHVFCWVANSLCFFRSYPPTCKRLCLQERADVDSHPSTPTPTPWIRYGLERFLLMVSNSSSHISREYSVLLSAMCTAVGNLKWCGSHCPFSLVHLCDNLIYFSPTALSLASYKRGRLLTTDVALAE